MYTCYVQDTIYVCTRHYMYRKLCTDIVYRHYVQGTMQRTLYVQHTMYRTLRTDTTYRYYVQTKCTGHLVQGTLYRTLCTDTMYRTLCRGHIAQDNMCRHYVHDTVYRILYTGLYLLLWDMQFNCSILNLLILYHNSINLKVVRELEASEKVLVSSIVTPTAHNIMESPRSTVNEFTRMYGLV